MLEAYEDIARIYNHHSESFGYVAYKQVVDRIIPHLPAGQIRLLDAGCGTGRVGPYLHNSHLTVAKRTTLLGLDYSPAMLKEAAQTNRFDLLIQRDINAPFDLPGRDVHAIVAAGVFLDNHVGPEAMIHLLKHLAVGGVACFSVRLQTFISGRRQYLAIVHEAGCVVVDEQQGDYSPGESVDGVYLVLRKE